jgi:uncharacterized protein
MRILSIPGWHGSGPQHWQSLWEAKFSNFERVEQQDWDHPDVNQWVAQLQTKLEESSDDVVLVAHSLGCLTVGQLTRSGIGLDTLRRTRAALLVSPALEIPECLRAFLPASFERLPFPSTIVASRTDPYLPFVRAKQLAQDWCGRLVEIGDAGHINTESGYGEWPEGERLLAELTKTGLKRRAEQ